MTQTLPNHNLLSLVKILFPLLIVLLLAACNRESNNNFKNPDAPTPVVATAKNADAQGVSQEEYAHINQQWLAENAQKDGVQTTASGLQYAVKKEGTGQTPTLADVVSVKYTGKLIDGTIFDSTDKNNQGEPISFPLEQVIEGWKEGLQLMKEGAEYTLFLPANLAYGEQDMGEIPPNSTLIFDVTLVKTMNMEAAVAAYQEQQTEQPVENNSDTTSATQP